MKKANTLVTKVGMKICSAAVKAAAISPAAAGECGISQRNLNN